MVRRLSPKPTQSADGQGKRRRLEDAAQRHRYQSPPLWRPDGYNDGAGMAWPTAAANFIAANLPQPIRQWLKDNTPSLRSALPAPRG
jgi:cytochrome c